MIKIILFLLLLFALGFFYSYISYKLSKSKLIILIPSLIGIILILYIRINSDPNAQDGLEAIRILIKEFVISSIMAGNILGWIFFSWSNKSIKS